MMESLFKPFPLEPKEKEKQSQDIFQSEIKSNNEIFICTSIQKKFELMENKLIINSN